MLPFAAAALRLIAMTRKSWRMRFSDCLVGPVYGLFDALAEPAQIVLRPAAATC